VGKTRIGRMRNIHITGKLKMWEVHWQLMQEIRKERITCGNIRFVLCQSENVLWCRSCLMSSSQRERESPILCLLLCLLIHIVFSFFILSKQNLCIICSYQCRLNCTNISCMFLLTDLPMFWFYILSFIHSCVYQ
jgi:hypothetical protein